MVEGELATAAKELPRFAAGGATSRTSSSSAAARLASRQRAAIKYSRFEAEVSSSKMDAQLPSFQVVELKCSADEQQMRLPLAGVAAGVGKLRAGLVQIAGLRTC
jgi:hypothetical protein